MLERVVPVALLLVVSPALRAQTIDDGILMSKKILCTGITYNYDSWSNYWEGTLKRDNENVGTVSTQTVMWMGTYGVTDRLNAIAMVPYVKTKASGGTLHGLEGFQDVSLAAKYQFLARTVAGGSLKAIAVASYAFPSSDYTPDLYPLSLGSAAQRAQGRLTLNYEGKRGFFLNATNAYTFRGTATLDRPAYYTDGQLFLTNEVALPNVYDYSVALGYKRHGFYVPITFSQQYTLGGGDIRRQDMPFVSNRMNFSKLNALVHYSPPQARSLTLRVEATYTPSGRNVGQSTLLGAGLLYAFHF